MCSGAVAAQRRNALRREEVAHRRVDVLIGAADVEPFRFSIAASVAIAVPQMPIR